MEEWKLEWLRDYLEGKRNNEFELWYHHGRRDVTSGRVPTEKGEWAYGIPKVAAYMDVSANGIEPELRKYIDEDELHGIRDFDVRMIGDMEILTIDDFRDGREEEELDVFDGNFAWVGEVVSATLEDFMEEESVAI